MSFIARIEKDYIDALKAKDELRVSVLRMVKSSLKNATIAARKELNDEEVGMEIQREVKKHRETMLALTQAGREDLRAREEGELEVLEAYLPEQLDDAAIEAILQKRIAENHWTMKDFGQAMGAAMAELKGKADGGRVNAMLKRLLTR
jgi:uncharacterized protein YqeY